MTLIEILVVVTLTTLVLGVVVSLLVSLRQWDRRLHEGGVRAEQLAQLAEAIRADIRQGTDVSVPTKEDVVITLPGDRETRYAVVPAGCQRRVGSGGEAVQSIDLFRVGPADLWSLEQGPPGRRPMIIVTLERGAGADRPGNVAPLIVYAALGADLPPVEPVREE